MNPQILKVHDIHASIKDIGLDHYGDRMVQDMAGNYFYVEIEPYNTLESHPGVGWDMAAVEYARSPGCDCATYYRYRIVPVPLRLAWFVIDCLKLKSMVMETGYSEHDGPNGGKVSVYLTPGTEFMGKTVDKLTEIPANVGPVVLERL